MRRGNSRTMWARALKEPGILRGFHFHDLRHTGNMWAAIYMHANKRPSQTITADRDGPAEQPR